MTSIAGTVTNVRGSVADTEKSSSVINRVQPEGAADANRRA